MNKNKELKLHHFGGQLEELMIFTGVKNTHIAKELNYDTSYISKWVTGKSLPSKKNIENILSVISDVLVSQSDETIIPNLLVRFNARNKIELQDNICSYLRNSYYDTSGEMNERIYMNNSALTVNPQGLFPLLGDYAKSLTGKENVSIAVMADILSLDPVSRLTLAGITNQHFALTKLRPDLKIDYIVDISSLDGTCVYNILLLIHMTTCFSLADFELYQHDSSKGKLLLTVDEEFTSASLLTDNLQFICTTTTKDVKTSHQMYQMALTHADPDKKIFFKTNMKELLLSHQYIQTLLSQNTRWLIGHITEQFISPELFTRLSEQFFDNEMMLEAKRAYYLTANAIQTNQIQIMVYGLALMQFALSGELDFFNNKVILSPDELQHEFEYLQLLFAKIDNNHLRMINEGFSDDFTYITNPHFCLSSSIGYLRLENKHYTNNLLLIRDEHMQKSLDVFFNTIWNYDSSIVISSKETIDQRLDTLIKATSFFTSEH